MYASLVQAEGKYGFESNVTVFLLDGYHGSVWYGENGYRVRVVTAKAVYPSGMVASGFKNKILTFNEIEFDVFFGKNKNDFHGAWVAGGLGRTKHEITSKTTDMSNQIYTIDIHFGTGYTHEILENFTVNPWLGGVYHVDAPDSVAVGDEIWSPKKINFVGGVKLGFEF